MKRLLLAGVSLAAIGLIDGAQAADASPPGKALCPYGGDPYKNYSCLDSYLGTDFFGRLVNYYRLEWGHSALSVHRMALWREHQPWRDAAEFG
jgi:hypothetical protein